MQLATDFIPVNAPEIGEREKQLVMDCLTSGWISSSGQYVTQFEQAFANYCECQHGVSTSNGTNAIHLALATLNIGKGDEVLVPAFTMAGCVYPIVQRGAIPVFVDSELETYNMDINDLSNKITSRSKAILAVHIYGHPLDMDPLLELAKKNNLYVIEDAAEAHGALYKGKKVGSFGDLGCFSFYANKIITTGEGGMITTNNAKLAQRARRLKDLGHGEQRFTHDLPEAYNYRMTNIQAAIGLGQLSRVEKIIQHKLALVDRYNKLLYDVSDFTLPHCKPWARNVYWMYGVVLKENSPLQKKDIMMALAAEGIGTRSFFYPLNEQRAFSQFQQDVCYNARFLSEHGFYLPSGQALLLAQVNIIVEKLKTICQRMKNS